jgi:hypothetical protein
LGVAIPQEQQSISNSSAHLSANTTYSFDVILTGGYLKLYINGALDAATAVACAEIKKTTLNMLIRFRCRSYRLIS